MDKSHSKKQFQSYVNTHLNTHDAWFLSWVTVNIFFHRTVLFAVLCNYSNVRPTLALKAFVLRWEKQLLCHQTHFGFPTYNELAHDIFLFFFCSTTLYGFLTSPPDDAGSISLHHHLCPIFHNQYSNILQDFDPPPIPWVYSWSLSHWTPFKNPPYHSTLLHPK